MPRPRPAPGPRLHVTGAVALAVLAAGGALPHALRAANPQPYTVDIQSTGNGDLDKALKSSSDLESLRQVAPVAPFALIARARSDEGRFETALHSFGYYQGHTTIRIDGHPLTDPALPDLLERLPNGQDAKVAVEVEKGPQFRIGRVVVTGDPSPDVLAKLPPVRPGAPAIAADVLSAAARMLTQARDDGHAFAKTETPVAVEHADTQTIDLTYDIRQGPRVALGPVRVTGLKDVNPGYVRNRLLVHQGEMFSPTAIQKARDDLASLGIFSTVDVQPATQVDAQGQLPITFALTEGPKYSVSLGAAYSTDLGFQGNVSWTDLNLFGNAERLTLSAANTQLLGSSSTGVGYDVAAHFVKPDFLHRDQSLLIDLEALKESIVPYDRTAELASIGLSRKISPDITVTLSLSGETEYAVQNRVGRRYNIAGVPLGLKFDNTDSLFDPTKGYRAAVTVTPSYSFSGERGAHDTPFVLMEASGSTYFDFTGNGRSILALRALLGSAEGGNLLDVPPDKRFYAGGSATVRGYRYLSVGPRFLYTNRPIGGLGIDAGTVEFRQRFGASWGAVAFVDAAQVSPTPAPFSGQVRVGAGVGGRYYTSIGPIRLDVAVPVTPEKKGDAFELYIGLGQAF